ncbi:MAG: carbohydrate ABC transporter permease [Armatimonadota bacterium]
MKSLWLRLADNETVVSYLFLLPNFLGFLVFTSLPVLASLGLSLLDWDVLTPPKYVGLANFVNLLGFHSEGGRATANDPEFWKYLYNTVYMMIGIPLGMAGSLITALALNQKLKGITFFRTVFFLPTACAGIAIYVLWIWIYNPEFGLMNAFLRQLFGLFHLNISPPTWLSSTTWAKPALMITGLWGAVGGANMLLYLAGLQQVPPELYEAAEIDGAGSWQKFQRITLPFLSPTTFFILIMSIIGGLQGGFMQAYAMTRGGPAGSTTTIDYFIYNNAYSYFKMGYAASIAWFLFIVVFIVTLINWKVGGKLVHY